YSFGSNLCGCYCVCRTECKCTGSVQRFVKFRVAEFVQSLFYESVFQNSVINAVLSEFGTEFRVLGNRQSLVVDDDEGLAVLDLFLDLFHQLSLFQLRGTEMTFMTFVIHCDFTSL